MRHGLVREAGYAGEAVIDDHNAKAIEPPIYYGPPDWSPRAYIDAAGYEAKYCASVTKPEASGRRRASASTGFKPYTRIKNTNFGLGHVSIRWFEDDTTNIAYNCIDRHRATRGD
jgi:acetyl-CoA synthetase